MNVMRYIRAKQRWMLVLTCRIEATGEECWGLTMPSRRLESWDMGSVCFYWRIKSANLNPSDADIAHPLMLHRATTLRRHARAGHDKGHGTRRLQASGPHIIGYWLAHDTGLRVAKPRPPWTVLPYTALVVLCLRGISII